MPRSSEPSHRSPAFDRLLALIESHPRYGPALLAAVRDKADLVLNYHLHPGAASWCVSICRKEPNPLEIFGNVPELEELAHIREFGPSEEECLPRSTALGRALARHYLLTTAPEVFKNGQPVAADGPEG